MNFIEIELPSANAVEFDSDFDLDSPNCDLGRMVSKCDPSVYGGLGCFDGEAMRAPPPSLHLQRGEAIKRVLEKKRAEALN